MATRYKLLSEKDLVTSVGDPGSDASVPSEQAVREGLDAVGGAGLLNDVAGDYCNSPQGTDSTSFVTTNVSVSITLASAGYIMATCFFKLYNQDAGEDSLACLFLDGSHNSREAVVTGNDPTPMDLSLAAYRAAGTYTVALYFKTGQTGGAYTAFVDDAALAVIAFTP